MQSEPEYIGPVHNAPCMQPPEEERLTIRQLCAAADWWASFLGISDWIIDIWVVRGFRVPDHYAEVTWEIAKRRATVSLMDPDDLPPGNDPYDMEQVLVHELLHVVLAVWDEGTKDEKINRDVAIEQPIERLSQSLVGMRRLNPETDFSWED